PLEKQSDTSYARFALQGNNHECTMLDSDKLCSIQKRHGEAMIPDVCSSFPRPTFQFGSRRYLTGNLACPEAARLCLLAEDAMEQVPSTPEAMGRNATVLPTEGMQLYVRNTEQVQDALVRIASWK